MGDIKLKIEDLILDHENPRIPHAEGQQEALQKVVKEQKVKLVKLAQSIADKGLNPMDRLLVLRLKQKPERFIALEGNRRVAVLKMLIKPSIMTGLEMAAPVKSVLEGLSAKFTKSQVEPISCFELGSRQEGDYWLQLRHKGEQGGAGIVDWSTTAQQRFRERTPAIQALDMVVERGGLTADQRTQITEKFPLSTLQRFIEDKSVRKILGIDVKQGKLVTSLPAAEVIKPLTKIVVDLATKKKKVSNFYKSAQMVEYIEGFDSKNSADLSKAKKKERTVDEIPISEFGKPAKAQTRRRSDPSDRKEVIPKNCNLHVSDNRAADIHKELRTLKLADSRNAIAVLLRVFLELSVDRFLEKSGSKLTKPKAGGGTYFKALDEKVREAVETLISVGANKSNFASVLRGLSDKTSPLHPELLHAYVHDRFSTPSPQQLTAAWDHAQPLFEKIWPHDL